MTGKAEASPSESPDVEIGATVKAERLRFDSAPDAEVTLHGDGRSRSGSERENLPDEVEPRVEYRGIEVRWEAAAYVEVEEAPALEREEASRVERKG